MNAQPMPVISSSVPISNTIIGHPTVRARPTPYPTNAVPMPKRAAQVRPTLVQPTGSSTVSRMRYAPATAGTSASIIQPKCQPGGSANPVPMIHIAPNNSNPVRPTTLSSPRNTAPGVASSSPNSFVEPAPSSSMLSQQIRTSSAPEPYRLPR
ncbi:hypothetical protein L596_016678 [Steinernema carpocapsae]|nr:hypothetical protein L596_016678 [Steinernema carpocapsae]